MATEKIQTEQILDQSVEVFSDVNNRINSLLACSADDFLILNKGFRDYHTKINELTDAAEKLFTSVIDVDDNITGNYRNNLKELSEEITSIVTFTINAERGTRQLIKDISYASLHLNNLRQNISTLKLLITNIQLEPKFRGLYQELINIINTLYECSRNLETNIQSTQKRARACSELIDDIRKIHIPAISEGTEKNIDLLSRLASKKQLCTKYSARLQELIKKKSSSSAEIITNLQFQDIVRQKIEHVHEMQTNLLNNLENFNLDKEKQQSDDNQIFKIIAQIRNIGSLQAAQLLHANNEYQKAVENITSKFEELDQIFSETIKIVNMLSPKGYNHEEYSLSELKKAHSYFELEFDTLIDQNRKLENMCKDITTKEESIQSSKGEITRAIKNCEGIIDKLKPLSLDTSKDKSMTNPLEQIIRSFGDIQDNVSEINDILQRSDESQEKLFQQEIKDYFTNLATIKDRLKPIRNQMQEIFLKSHSNSKEVLLRKEADLKEKDLELESIKYYKVFDKEIEEIISKLNELIGQINFEEIEKNLSVENIEDIQKLYTMESEREVHAQITGIKHEQNSSDKNDDDIELF